MSLNIYNGRLSEEMLDEAREKRQKPYFSQSLSQQIQVEFSVEQCFSSFLQENVDEDGVCDLEQLLKRDQHIDYLSKSLFHLKREHELLDASKPWIVYWIVHSLALLKKEVLSEEICDKVVRFLNCCQNETGGFGGGPGQFSHLAPTFAAVNAIATIGVGYDMINRKTLLEWLWRLKRSEDSSFQMHEGGESDVRAVYCALSICRLVNIGFDDGGKSPLFDGTIEYILNCQTYEGGFGENPGCEAHGGYTYCAIASLAILDRVQLCDFDKALRWVAMRQMQFEGGFQGRTNKLVDGCYSFWVGVLFILLGKQCASSEWVFDEIALQEYILHACQDNNGGFHDKPGKNTDFYHTCYTLSGLSLAQHASANKSIYLNNCKGDDLAIVHPLHNITMEAAHAIRCHFLSENSSQIGRMDQ